MSAEPGGSQFVANYPPFGVWSGGALDAVAAVVGAPPARAVPLGLYVHIPFCRKRCRFCYFKVYTDVSAAEIEAYVDAVVAEARAWAEAPVLDGRAPRFVYIGGGTPSYLSTSQLRRLFEGLRAALPWADDAEVTFECEPGTLRRDKLEVLRALGVTRLSLGVESFDDGLLEANGRAHRVQHVWPAYEAARELGFDSVNLDLIAGLLGETDATWARSVAAALEAAPDSLTIYQLDVPGNTTIARALRTGDALPAALPDIDARARWKAEAFDALTASGWTLSSAYTLVRPSPRGLPSFVYRDALWHGADLVPLGVSSFGHLQGAHVQNAKHREVWAAGAGRSWRAGWERGHVMGAAERAVREWVLRLKLGRVPLAPWAAAFGRDPREAFAAPLADLARRGMVEIDPEAVALTRRGLLQVDALLPAFFLREHGGRTEGWS